MSTDNMLELIGTLTWQVDAACANVPDADAIFFPGVGKSLQPAKDICADCPVREDCLEFALDNLINYGVWGGTSGQERRRMTDRRLGRVRAINHGTTGGYATHRRRGEAACAACKEANARYQFGYKNSKKQSP